MPLQLVLGIGFAFISGSMTALLVDSISLGDAHEVAVKRALGWLGAATRVGGVLSFALASALFPDTREWRYFWPIMATAGAGFASAAIVALVRESPTAVRAATARSTSLSLILLVSTAYQAAIGLPLGALAERSLSAWCLIVAAIIALSTVSLRLRKSFGGGCGVER